MKYTIFWSDEEGCYRSQMAPGKGKLSPDNERSVEMLRELHSDLGIPPFKDWVQEDPWSLYVWTTLLVNWECEECNTGEDGVPEHSVPFYCPSCKQPVGHHDEHLDEEYQD